MNGIHFSHPIPLPASPLKGEESDVEVMTCSSPFKGTESDVEVMTCSLPFKGR